MTGMSNVDIGGNFHLWYTSGFFLMLALASVQVIAIYTYYSSKRWITTLYLIFDSALMLCITFWLAYGAYWRFCKFGIKCTSYNIPNQGEGLFLFYMFILAIAGMSLFMCCFGCCACYWSNYVTEKYGRQWNH